MTVGSDQLDAYQDVTSPAVGTFDAKIHLKSFISDVLQGPHSLFTMFYYADLLVHAHSKSLNPT